MSLTDMLGNKPDINNYMLIIPFIIYSRTVKAIHVEKNPVYF